MRCSEARAALWPPEKPCLASGVVPEARRHIEECDACAEYLAQDRALLECYERMRGTRAPRHVKERVFDTLARERAGAIVPGTYGDDPVGASEPRWRASATAAALLLAALGGVTLVTSAGRPVAEEAMFVEDYLRRAVGAEHIESSDPAEVSRFVTRELGQAFSPLMAEELELQRAEICLLEGRRGAMIVYKRHGQVISHYVVPRESGLERSPARGRDSGGGSAGAPSVITWSSARLEQALVSEASAESLLRLARAASSLE